MTNFERWKRSLKPEDLVFKEGNPLGDRKSNWAIWNVDGDECDSCPARELCQESEDLSCGEVFLKWANFDCLKERDEKRCVKCTHPCDEAWIAYTTQETAK